MLSRLSRARAITGQADSARPGALDGPLHRRDRTEAIPAGLLSATARASLCFTKEPATAAGLSSAAAVALARGVIYAMLISKLKVIGAAALVCGCMVGGLRAIGVHSDGTRAARADHDAEASGPAGKSAVSRVSVTSTGSISANCTWMRSPRGNSDFEFEGVVDPGLSLKIEVPGFATVKNVRLGRRGADRPGDVGCFVTLALDTKLAGRHMGNVKARLGDQEASVPVVASVAAAEAGRTKVLVISSGFGSYSHRANDNLPWFDLVRQAKLDVSYMESPNVPIGKGPPVTGNLSPLPEELARYDVILLADGGVVFLNANTSLMMGQFADAGKRVILMASPAMGETVLQANRILDPMGMQMVDWDIEGPEPGYPRIETTRLEPDRLLDGVTKLTTFRPASIKISDPTKAKILAYFPGSRDGFVAVSRHGKGEVVAIGLVGLALDRRTGPGRGQRPVSEKSAHDQGWAVRRAKRFGTMMGGPRPPSWHVSSLLGRANLLVSQPPTAARQEPRPPSWRGQGIFGRAKLPLSQPPTAARQEPRPPSWRGQAARQEPRPPSWRGQAFSGGRSSR